MISLYFYHLATVNKLIREMLPNDIKCANETRDLIVECCVGKWDSNVYNRLVD